MSDKLPDNIIDIEILRINRNIDKECKCNRWERRFTIDTANKKVYCGCGAEVDPYDAIYDIAYGHERLQAEIKKLLEQRKQIVDYKPWLLVFRNLESHWRGNKDLLPTCPHCGRGFYFEELTRWINKRLEDLRREKEDTNEK
jgi:predicted molibdopterin-dependent oxidoreductase YjgC